MSERVLFHFVFQIVLIICLVSQINAARILAIFPVPSISHQVVFRPFTLELSRRGHEVVILTADPAYSKGETPANIKEIDVHDISYKMWEKEFVDKVDANASSSLKVIINAMKRLSFVFEEQSKAAEMKKILSGTESFDLILAEACARLAISVSIVVKAPVIQISSFGYVPPNHNVIGTPMHPLIYPEVYQQRLNNLSIWEKLDAVHMDYDMQQSMRDLEVMDNEIIKRVFGPKSPTVQELYDNVHMMFLNINPIWEGNRPVPPSVIYLGGLHLAHKQPQDLPKDLKTYLDGSKHGVIYFSLGTNVKPSLLPTERIKIFCKVFSKLPYDILWKWDKDNLPEKPDNVKIFKWLPQYDLLRHPKIKLFITQAGLQSTDEAISAGVPLLAFPILGDQWFNAEKYVKHKIGIKLAIETITESELDEAVKTVIEDQSFRKNMLKLQSLMNDQPQTPLERAIWWTEYVIRHKGAKHLRSPIANISWSEFLMLDVVLMLFFILIVVITIIFISYKIIRSFLVSQDLVKKNL